MGGVDGTARSARCGDPLSWIERRAAAGLGLYPGLGKVGPKQEPNPLPLVGVMAMFVTALGTAVQAGCGPHYYWRFAVQKVSGVGVESGPSPSPFNSKALW